MSLAAIVGEGRMKRMKRIAVDECRTTSRTTSRTTTGGGRGNAHQVSTWIEHSLVFDHTCPTRGGSQREDTESVGSRYSRAMSQLLDLLELELEVSERSRGFRVLFCFRTE